MWCCDSGVVCVVTVVLCVCCNSGVVTVVLCGVVTVVLCVL